jgi:hypothetical protein
MGRVVNRPKVSRWIGGMYICLTIFIFVLYIGVTFATDMLSAPLAAKAFFFGLAAFVVLIMIVTTAGLYGTKYVIESGRMYSWSPFAVIRLDIKDVVKVEKTLIPFHMKVGASLYSGLFYIPSLGWVKSIVTNVTDGLLITARGGKRYLITPSNPLKFAKMLSARKSKAAKNAK